MRQVPWARLARIPLYTPFTVTTLESHGRTWRYVDVTCTFLEANHCPGAVMVRSCVAIAVGGGTAERKDCLLFENAVVPAIKR